MATPATSAAAVLSPEAEAIKQSANAMFAGGKFLDAVDEYTRAIELAPTNAILYNNRAFANFKVENYGSAIADATEALKHDPTFIKAFYRRGSSLVALNRYKDALDDFRQVVTLAPRDADARKKFTECQAMVRKQAFEAAIASADPKSIFDEFDFSSIVVPADYAGPRLADPDNSPEASFAARVGLTQDFVIDMMEHFRNQKTLPKVYVYRILSQAYRLFRALPSLVELSVPEGGHFTVCGDVHGQFYDLLNLFTISGNPSPTNSMLFNGDFVDRGSFATEVVLTLLCWRLLLPDNFNMLRGNHESKNMNKMYGFTGEVNQKYGEKAMSMFEELFQSLPLAATINGKIFVTHGGLFQKDEITLKDIKATNRFREPPDDGIMSDLLWSDPQPLPGRMPSKRGVGCSFGPDVTRRFLETNGLKMVIRSHEVKDEGYLVEHDGLLATVFSAPNYCDQMGNKGAFVRFGADLTPNFTSFSAVPHPNIKPMAYGGGGGLGGMFM